MHTTVYAGVFAIHGVGSRGGWEVVQEGRVGSGAGGGSVCMLVLMVRNYEVLFLLL